MRVSGLAEPVGGVSAAGGAETVPSGSDGPSTRADPRHGVGHGAFLWAASDAGLIPPGRTLLEGALRGRGDDVARHRPKGYSEATYLFGYGHSERLYVDYSPSDEASHWRAFVADAGAEIKGRAISGRIHALFDDLSSARVEERGGVSSKKEPNRSVEPLENT